MSRGGNRRTVCITQPRISGRNARWSNSQDGLSSLCNRCGHHFKMPLFELWTKRHISPPLRCNTSSVVEEEAALIGGWTTLHNRPLPHPVLSSFPPPPSTPAIGRPGMADLSLPSASAKDIPVFSRGGFFTDKQMFSPLTFPYPFHLSCIQRTAHIDPRFLHHMCVDHRCFHIFMA